MSVDFREAMSSSISYWEPRRLVYNAVLALIVVAWFVAGWPGSKESLGTDLALGLFILAVLANVAYCAVYLPDLALQFSTFRDAWLRWRWALLTIGTLFAAALTYFFAQGMFAVHAVPVPA
ncbi:MAG TPA: hypothetical protein VFL16_05250 [Steroidobacteraceae bacterium]|jgi:hypothetical protein|nr:hypothetical protein [Steroidobacteraceae bacterium]